MSTPAEHDMAGRKAAHLDICLHPETYDIEGGSPLFSEIRFRHKAAPEVDGSRLDLTRDFLGYKLKLPFFISCMTGGSDQAYQVNRDLAAAAQTLGLPVGMGSGRILFRKPEVLPHFELKKIAPDVPVLTNIGGVQIREMNHQDLIEMNKRLEVDAQVIHLNPGQEIFQPDGDRDFRGIRQAVRKFIKTSPIPVVVKETGFGMDPEEVEEFLDAGAAYVDVAGSGGTNWAKVEGHRLPSQDWQAVEEFTGWGWPTALLVHLTAPAHPGRILSSGGLRTGMDAAKSLAMGAHLAGTALPVVKAVKDHGPEGVVAFYKEWEQVLRAALVLTGCENLSKFSQISLIFSKLFLDWKASIQKD